jgi:hypothetical protein
LRLVGMCDQGRWLFVQEGLEGFGFEWKKGFTLGNFETIRVYIMKGAEVSHKKVTKSNFIEKF